jgi:hypothetical protein
VITDLLLVLLVVLLNLLKFSHTIMFISFQQENGVMWKTYKIVFNIHYRTQSQCGGIFSQWEAVTYCCCCCLCGVYLFHLIYTTPYSVLCAWFCNKIIELITLKLKFLETSIGKVNSFKSRVVNVFFCRWTVALSGSLFNRFRASLFFFCYSSMSVIFRSWKVCWTTLSGMLRWTIHTIQIIHWYCLFLFLIVLNETNRFYIGLMINAYIFFYQLSPQ